MTPQELLRSRLIGTLFVERGLVSESQIRVALEIQQETDQQLGEILVERFGVSRAELAQRRGRAVAGRRPGRRACARGVARRELAPHRRDLRHARLRHRGGARAGADAPAPDRRAARRGPRRARRHQQVRARRRAGRADGDRGRVRSAGRGTAGGGRTASCPRAPRGADRRGRLPRRSRRRTARPSPSSSRVMQQRDVEETVEAPVNEIEPLQPTVEQPRRPSDGGNSRRPGAEAGPRAITSRPHGPGRRSARATRRRSQGTRPSSGRRFVSHSSRPRAATSSSRSGARRPRSERQSTSRDTASSSSFDTPCSPLPDDERTCLVVEASAQTLVYSFA